MGLRKIGWILGLTKERKTELSDVLYETGSVTAKNYQEEEDNLPLGVAMGNIDLGVALSEDEKYNISFRGPRTSFDFEDEGLFRAFKVGDKVKIGFREEYTVTSDYIPPNFDQKQQLDRVLSRYRFVSVDKTK
jgi:hypothetical protein